MDTEPWGRRGPHRIDHPQDLPVWAVTSSELGRRAEETGGTEGELQLLPEHSHTGLVWKRPRTNE